MSYNFDKFFIEKVRSANNIVDVVSQHCQIKKSGSSFMGLCPFPDHNEKTPSFSVSEEGQFYHCFGCKKSGDIFTFAQELQGMSFPESVEYFAKKASLALPEKGQKEGGSQRNFGKETRTHLEKINGFAARVFHHQLLKEPEGSLVKKYCLQRGLNREVIEAFQIGFAKKEWEALSQKLSREGVSLEKAEGLGLVKKRQKGGAGYFDLFRGRLMFPILSTKQVVIGFGGRSLEGEMPKYINSPESELFHKGRCFFGLNHTAKFIRSQDEVLVVEGYMDLIALYSKGIKNVVATLGTALTETHAKILKRYTRNVKVLFDSDEAGVKAAIKSLPLLLSQGLYPFHVYLDDGMDPDDYVNQFGREGFLKKVEDGKELFIFVLEHFMQGYRGALSEKVRVQEKLNPFFASLQEPSLRELYIREVAERLRVKPQWVTRSIKNYLNQKKASQQTDFVNRPPDPRVSKGQKGEGAPFVRQESKLDLTEVSKTELYLLNLSIKFEKVLLELKAKEFLEELLSPQAYRLLALMWTAVEQEKIPFSQMFAFLISRVREKGPISQHLDKPMKDFDDENGIQLMKDCLKKLQEQQLKKTALQIKTHIAGGTAEEQLKKLEQIMNIKKRTLDL